MTEVEVLSSDLDDIPLAARVNAPSSWQPSLPTSEDPEWVQSYTPVKANSREESDSDSLLNILSGEEAGGETQPSQVSQAVEGDASQQVGADAAPKKRKPSRAAGAPRSELKLVMAPRLEEGLTLLQADGADLDLSGDVGAVGRVKIEDGEALLDIKGALYKALPYACNAACVMTIGDTEAKISAVLGEAVALRTVENVFAAGLSGAQDGHNFEYDDAGLEAANVKEAANGSQSQSGGADGAQKKSNGNRGKAKTAKSGRGRGKGRK